MFELKADNLKPKVLIMYEVLTLLKCAEKSYFSRLDTLQCSIDNSENNFGGNWRVLNTCKTAISRNA